MSASMWYLPGSMARDVHNPQCKVVKWCTVERSEKIDSLIYKWLQKRELDLCGNHKVYFW